MPTGTGAPAKEATILSLSQDIRKILGDFQNRLGSYFDRNVKAEEGTGVMPTTPNVLDEIIKELEEGKAHLSQIMSFISSDVLPKIN